MTIVAQAASVTSLSESSKDSRGNAVWKGMGWIDTTHEYISARSLMQEAEERSAIQIAGPRCLSVNHAASQLMAPSTHPLHYDLDQWFYPDALLPMRITIPRKFVDTEVYRDVCFTCYEEYEQKNLNGP